MVHFQHRMAFQHIFQWSSTRRQDSAQYFPAAAFSSMAELPIKASSRHFQWQPTSRTRSPEATEAASPNPTAYWRGLPLLPALPELGEKLFVQPFRGKK